MSAIRTVVLQQNKVAQPAAQGPMSVVLSVGARGEQGPAGPKGDSGADGTTTVTPLTAAQIASPSAPILASSSVYRAPNGSLLVSDGTQLRTTSRVTPGLKIVLFQSSGGARGNSVRDVSAGQITGNGSVLTVDTDTNLFLHSGAYVLLGALTGAPTGVVSTIDDITAFGPIRRLGTKRFEMDYSGPSGTTSVKFDLLRQEHYSFPSIFRAWNRRAGGCLNRLATFAIGGQNSTQKLSQYLYIIEQLKPDRVYGDWGTNNDALDNTPLATTFANIKKMATAFLAAGIGIDWPTSPAIYSSTPARVAKAKAIEQYVRELAANNPNFFIIDQFADTVDRSTGLSYPELIADVSTAGFHQCYEGAELYSATIYEAQLAAGRLNPTGWPDRLVGSAQDRRSQDASSNQLYEGNYAASGINAATFDSKTVGEVDPGVGLITTTGNAGRSLVCSYVDREDGNGKETRGVFSATAGDTMTMSWIGPAGSLLKDLVDKTTQTNGRGRRAFVGVDLNLWGDVPGTIRSWELTVECQASYPGASNAYARLSSYNNADTNAAEPPLGIAVVGPCHFPEFDLPAGITAMSTLAITLIVTHDITQVSRFALGRLTYREL